jgi:peptide/nickel transport system substrate-binding protein
VTFTRRGSAFPIGATEPLFYPIDSAQNFTGIGPARFGEGFDTVLRTLNDDLRARRVAKLDELLLDEVPMIPLAVTPLVVAVQDDVVNYGAAQFEQPDWTRVGFTKKR